MKKYEYKIAWGSVDFDADADEYMLTEKGKEGWELVSWIEGKAKGEGIGAKRIYYYMKREIKE